MEDNQKQENNILNFSTYKKKNYFLNFILYLSFLLLVNFLFYFFFLSSPYSFPKDTIIEIKQGENLRELSFDLKNKKVIRSRFIFETFLIIYGGERHLAVGDYLFEDKLPVFEVARRIAQKDRRLASIKLTIPEGFDNQQIAESASLKLKNFDKEKFLNKAKQGYLFPDTYFFFSSDNEQDVLRYLSENYKKKINSLKKDIESSGKNENEIITMASLIEREAKGDSDRRHISGILWNRIKKNMPLQVDAFYDTYKKKGLPKDPICNPGMDAIMASLYPIQTHYLYYLHDKNGEIHYASTFEEHKKNKIKYLKQ